MNHVIKFLDRYCGIYKLPLVNCLITSCGKWITIHKGMASQLCDALLFAVTFENYELRNYLITLIYDAFTISIIKFAVHYNSENLIMKIELP